VITVKKREYIDILEAELSFFTGNSITFKTDALQKVINSIHEQIKVKLKIHSPSKKSER
jgi:hypothetical protein